MNELMQPIATSLADYYLLATLLLGVAMLAQSFMRQPAWKLTTAKATIAGLFILAVLCVIPRPTALHLSGVKPNADTGSDTRSASSARKHSGTTALSNASDDSKKGTGNPTERRTAPASNPSPPVEGTPTKAASEDQNSGFQFLPWLAVAFLVGTLVLAVRNAIGAWHLRKLCREAERPSAKLTALFEEVAGPTPLLPRLLIHDRLPSAVATGVRDTSILIPKSLVQGGDDRELRSVLGHEWAHVKNGDLTTLAAGRLLSLLLWAHPLFWLFRRRVRLAQEHLADASAAEITTRHDYAAQLVDWAKALPPAPHRSLSSAVGMWEGPSQLRRRVDTLLDEKITVLKASPRRWGVTVGVACTISVGVLQLITLRPAHAEDPPKMGSENGVADGTNHHHNIEPAAAKLIDSVYQEQTGKPYDALTVEQRQQRWRIWLDQFLAQLQKTKDPATRERLSQQSLGYANSLGKWAVSEKLLLELVELAGKDNHRGRARWLAELGGIYRRMADTGLARVSNLKRSLDTFGQTIAELHQIPAQNRSASANFRLIITHADRGRTADALYKEITKSEHLKVAAESYREGAAAVQALIARTPGKTGTKSPHQDSSGSSHADRLAELRRLGYDAEWFALQELLTCAPLRDDERAGILLPALLKSPGSEVDRDSKVLRYAKARYGIKTYPEFLEFWRNSIRGKQRD